MRDRLFRGGLLCGIIILFVGAGVVPSINWNIGKMDGVEVEELETCSYQNLMPLGISFDTNEKIPYFPSDDSLEFPKYVSGELIVKFREEVDVSLSSSPNGVLTTGIASVDILNSKYGLTSAERLSEEESSSFLSNVFRFTFSDDVDFLSIVEEYNLDQHVEYAEPHYVYYVCITPDDPYFYVQWALNQSYDADVDGPEAWDIATGSSDITIAIIDTGVDYTHPDLAENCIQGYDFIGHDFDPKDDDGHGTHCAGIASAVGNNGVGISGVCWNCKIMPVKALNREGIGWSINLAKAIKYGTDNGADVISMSWGSYSNSILIRAAIKYAYAKGVVLVSAAGNEDSFGVHYPAAYTRVIAVAATDDNDEIAGFSNYGSWVDVAAPGVDIFSTVPGDKYLEKSGTSMACPHVAGLASLVLSKNPDLSPDAVRNIICQSADRLPPTVSKNIRSGRVNAYEALLRGTGQATATISSPSHGAEVSGIIDVVGTAKGEDFRYFIVEYNKGKCPEKGNWIELVNSTKMIEDNVICSFDSTVLYDGLYNLRLKIICGSGMYRDTIHLLINNEHKVLIVDDDGGAGVDYTSIQEAVYDAGTGDSVYVYNGIYNERVRIYKSINLTGETQHNTIINGSDNGNIIYVAADKVYISGFTIKNTLDHGLFLSNAHNCVIWRNIVTDNRIGIKLENSNRNVIHSNDIIQNSIGVRIVKRSIKNNINHNNFINDGPRFFYEHASYKNSYFNNWNENYWNSWIGLTIPAFKKIPKFIPYRESDSSFLLGFGISRLRFNFDWHPAKEPYDIPS